MKVMKWNIVLLMFAGFVLSTGHATVIDSYQTPQTADRDDPQFRPASETITGNRLFAIDGSAVNASIGSGELRCDLGNDESSCSTLYNAEQFVDLTENNQNMGIKIFVSAISGPGEVSIQFTDTTNLSSGTLTALSLGENLIEFSDLFPINGQPDYSRIKGILIGFSTEAAQTSISIELIETANGSGPSGQGFSLNNQNSATFFDPARDGEGIQFIVLPDNETIVMTWYTYLNGDQVWLIGAGEMNTNPTTFDLTITDGATFGEDFDPTTVNRTLWGTASITLPDCNTLSLNATPVLAEFESVNLQMQRLLTADCGTLNQSPTNQQNAVNFENSGRHAMAKVCKSRWKLISTLWSQPGIPISMESRFG